MVHISTFWKGTAPSYLFCESVVSVVICVLYISFRTPNNYSVTFWSLLHSKGFPMNRWFSVNKYQSVPHKTAIVWFQKTWNIAHKMGCIYKSFLSFLNLESSWSVHNFFIWKRENIIQNTICVWWKKFNK